MHGFNLIKREDIREIHSEGFYYEHERLGVKLVFLKNDDPNRVFAAGFRTTSNNSTGVAHIVEHCVLSGSRKYHTKEPFMDLLKGSLQTFLNAMTFPEKTIYPVASRNEKDFRNLMDTYLDAVFFPKLLEDERIFLQEGWRYEIHSKEEPLTISGVVYNEMKGAMSAPEAVVGQAMLSALFPESFYAYNSGGDPYEIPTLTYEEFKEFYKKHYHPSNGYLFLYGDLDIEYYLEYIDREYLSHFDRRTDISTLPEISKLKAPVDYKDFYNVSEGEGVEDKTFYSFACSFGENGNVFDTLLLSLLDEVLVDSDAALLKNTLLEGGFCEDLYSASESSQKPMFGLVLKNVKEEKLQEIKGLIRDVLEKIVREGLDLKLLEASLNKIEFNLKEGGADFHTKGVIYYIEVMDHWIFGADPISILKTDEPLKLLREKIGTDFFEKIIRERILDNPDAAWVEVAPKEGLTANKDIELQKKLEIFKDSLSEEELLTIIKKADDLKKMQEEPDTPEALSTIPRLALSDVSEEMGVIPYIPYDTSYAPFFHHEAFTSGIAYFKMSTYIADYRLKDLQYASLAASLLGSLDTKYHTYQELSNEVYLSFGDLRFSVSCFEHMRHKYEMAFFNVSGKVLRENIEKVIPLLKEILSYTKWDNKKRIFELLQMMKSRYETFFIMGGNSYAMTRAKSYVSKTAFLSDMTGGIGFYFFIKELLEKYDDMFDEISHNLSRAALLIGIRSNTMGMITGERKDYYALGSRLVEFLRSNPIREPEANPEIKLAQKNEGIIINSSVQFVSKAAYLPSLGEEINGVDLFIRFLVGLDYLHNNIRAMGGAYGAGLTVDGNAIALFSYRDPNLERTIEVFNKMADELERINLSKEELTQNIIGTMNARNPAMTDRVKGEVALFRILSCVSDYTFKNINYEILNVDNEKIRERAWLYRKAMEQNNLTVFGSGEKISSSKELFKNIITIS